MQVPRHYECKYLLSHGREYCDNARSCPICSKAKSMHSVKELLTGDSFSSNAPTVFVGRYGYPNVNMGIMAPPEQREDAWDLDAPKNWAGLEYQIPKLIDLRSSLVNSRFITSIKTPNKLMELGQEVAMAAKPADLEIDLKKRPSFKMNFKLEAAPSGPNATLKKARLTENPKIPFKVEKVFSDMDFKAVGAINKLYKSGFDENYLSRILSAGTLGVKTQRKLVPTRWSITATDDTIVKELLKSVRDNSQGEYWTWFGGYLGNYFLVLSFPDVWRYELFELFVTPDRPLPAEQVPFTTDFEDYSGRKEYATNTAGGYYASRFAVVEEMVKRKKQCSVLVLRFITEQYAAPLGVWVVREATRKSMAVSPLEFASEELLLKYAEIFVKKKFGYELSFILKKSKLLREVRTQKKLNSFL